MSGLENHIIAFLLGMIVMVFFYFTTRSPRK